MVITIILDEGVPERLAEREAANCRQAEEDGGAVPALQESKL